MSLEIDLHVQVQPDHFPERRRARTSTVSNQDLPDACPGPVSSDRWSFGQPVYLKCDLRGCPSGHGVESVEVHTFKRQAVPESAGLDGGRLDMAALEIARLDNDRNFP